MNFPQSAIVPTQTSTSFQQHVKSQKRNWQKAAKTLTWFLDHSLLWCLLFILQLTLNSSSSSVCMSTGRCLARRWEERRRVRGMMGIVAGGLSRGRRRWWRSRRWWWSRRLRLLGCPRETKQICDFRLLRRRIRHGEEGEVKEEKVFQKKKNFFFFLFSFILIPSIPVLCEREGGPHISPGHLLSVVVIVS